MGVSTNVSSNLLNYIEAVAGETQVVIGENGQPTEVAALGEDGQPIVGAENVAAVPEPEVMNTFDMQNNFCLTPIKWEH